MNRDTLIQALKTNTFLLAIAAGALVLAAAMALFGGGSDEKSSGPLTAGSDSADADEIAPGPFKAGGTNRTKAEGKIVEYQKILETQPEGEAAAINLRRIANLYYSPVMNYEQAIQHYERLLHDYPDWPGRLEIFLNLSECYARTGNAAMEKTTYEQMLKLFADDTQQYLYAQQKLDGTMETEQTPPSP